jgi:hypothetical protein
MRGFNRAVAEMQSGLGFYAASGVEPTGVGRKQIRQGNGDAASRNWRELDQFVA